MPNFDKKLIALLEELEEVEQADKRAKSAEAAQKQETRADSGSRQADGGGASGGKVSRGRGRLGAACRLVRVPPAVVNQF
jgi:hypothetical protein